LSSLEGIENLVNLKIICCNNNQLTSLKEIENLINLTQLNCNNNQLASLKGIENLNSLLFLEYLNCYYNKLTSLEGIENLINLKELFCSDNQLTSLEGIESLVKLIKNNKQIKNKIKYTFIDADDYIELNNLFENLINCKKNRKVNNLIGKIEQMIYELKGFEKYVLK
jgi:Leucine-rich repeat (LRR) protein